MHRLRKIAVVERWAIKSAASARRPLEITGVSQPPVIRSGLRRNSSLGDSSRHMERVQKSAQGADLPWGRGIGVDSASWEGEAWLLHDQRLPGGSK